MADWLRPVWGGRTTKAVTPVLGFSEGFTNENNESEDSNYTQPRTISRFSSFIGSYPATPSISQLPVSASNSFTNFRSLDSVYHEPSGDQMVEMLKVALMNQSSFTPLPIEYNSCILHVLEAYYELKCKVERKEGEIKQLQELHTKDVKEFEALSKIWEVKEKDYVVELKNLEVLLSMTKGGLEKVTLARTKSRVHGLRRVGDTIRREISTIKHRNSKRNSRGTRDRGLSLFSLIYLGPNVE
jgi:uncharacterized protein (DUF2344 family)